ncbi:polysaccharide biosynthesis tyrosine autokinase [Demequina gelatinilytica]|uniref:polysaccharide biosynthesis tyrosine autokinase n=1 Tax=Demequina gelatinilytica TaxID=1638980 RepID=UPI000783F7CE|nr:polysaccharide biosynthesis tyrosine autokinase [Demequina gelatinilytica]
MEFRDYLVVLRSRWISITLCTLLVGVLAYAWTSTQPRVYSSSGEVLVTIPVSGDAIAADNYTRTRVASYVAIAESDQVAQYASEQEGVTGTPGSLLARVNVSNPSDTALLRFSAKGPTPESAKRLVEVWIDGTTEAINVIEAQARNTSQELVTVTSLTAPRLPVFPTSPQVKQTVAVGLFLGFILGVALAFVRASLDRRVRTRDDVERKFGVPVVGQLPWDGALAKSGPADSAPGYLLTEAVRQLRTNLQFMNVDNPPRVLVVTSPVPGDGKSTVSLMLAEAIAESGRPVVLVDADLRRPTLAKVLGLDADVGLTSVLANQATLDEVVQKAGSSGRLSVLAAGIIPPNPSELVGSDAMRNLLYSFPEDVMVLVDTPPLVPVTDAAVLAARTDGALVVARSGKTTVDMLDEALRILERVQGRALGVILDGATAGGPRVKQYGGYQPIAPVTGSRAGSSREEQPDEPEGEPEAATLEQDEEADATPEAHASEDEGDRHAETPAEVADGDQREAREAEEREADALLGRIFRS